jgi:hypothetical protein
MALTEKERTWLDSRFNEMSRLLTQARIDIATLKVKSGIWGIIGGSIPTLIVLLAYWLPRFLDKTS